jgi:hypothetical protein
MKAYAKGLEGARYALWKSPEDLTSRQEAELAWISAANTRLYRAFLLNEGRKREEVWNSSVQTRTGSSAATHPAVGRQSDHRASTRNGPDSSVISREGTYGLIRSKADQLSPVFPKQAHIWTIGTYPDQLIVHG